MPQLVNGAISALSQALNRLSNTSGKFNISKSTKSLLVADEVLAVTGIRARGNTSIMARFTRAGRCIDECFVDDSMAVDNQSDSRPERNPGDLDSQRHNSPEARELRSKDRCKQGEEPWFNRRRSG
jgi:hypothetical protein